MFVKKKIPMAGPEDAVYEPDGDLPVNPEAEQPVADHKLGMERRGSENDHQPGLTLDQRAQSTKFRYCINKVLIYLYPIGTNRRDLDVVFIG